MSKRMTQQVVMSKENYVKGTNKYEVKLKKALTVTPKTPAFLSINRFSMFKSSPNILPKQYGNADFWITWIDGTTKQFQLSGGCYEVADINEAIQKCMYNEGWCVVDDGDETKGTFFINLSVNVSLYGCQLDILALPTISQMNANSWVKPSSATWTTPTNNSDVIDRLPTIRFSNGLCDMLGFDYQCGFGKVKTVRSDYPQSAEIIGLANEIYADRRNDAISYDGLPSTIASSTRSYLSTCASNINKNFVCNVSCNILTNDLGEVPIITSLTLNSKVGAVISDAGVSNKQQLTVREGTHHKIILELLNQDFEPLPFLDPYVSCVLLFEQQLEE